MALRVITLVLFLLLNPSLLMAAESLTFGHLNTQQLKEIFSYYNYNGEKGYLQVKDYNYPPLFFNYFPNDFSTITDENERNATFIKILAPLTIRLNNEIIVERKEILAISKKFKKDKKLSNKDKKFIEEKASKYDIFTRLKDSSRYNYILKCLYDKVHVIPPSILITASALETNWGTSRIVKEGNSLYKQVEWHTDKGLKPIGENEDDSYRIKIYPNIYASMQEFALKINSALAYDDLRKFRHQILERGTPLLGTLLAPYMVWNSPLKNYAGLFDYTLAYYELIIIDKSVLNSKIIHKELPKKLQKLVL